MDLYPAIDIRDGGAVRLTQGDFDRQSDYGDPVALADRFVAGGAPWLHVVDLDARPHGRPGQPGRRSLAIARAVDVPVETGGGVRTVDDVAELLDGGVARVILGTAALDAPDLVRRATAAYPGPGGPRPRLPPDDRRPGRGGGAGLGGGIGSVPWARCSTRWPAPVWPRWSSPPSSGTARWPAPTSRASRAVLASTEVPVIASGGVGSVADIAALAALEVGRRPAAGRRRLAGAITGKALVDGRMTVEEGVAACAPSG